MYSQQKGELEKELADRDGLSVAIESAVTFINLFSAISGNVLVCWTIIKYPRLRNTANIFIACLSLSDVLLAALGFPLTLAVLLTAVCRIRNIFSSYSDPNSNCTLFQSDYAVITQKSLHQEEYCPIYNSSIHCINDFPNVFDTIQRIFIPSRKIHLYLWLWQGKSSWVYLDGNIFHRSLLRPNRVLLHLHFLFCPAT